MNKIELKPGLYLEGDYAYISNPRIASCFLKNGITAVLNKSYECHSMKVGEYTYNRYPLKIHKSIFKSEVEPVSHKKIIAWYVDKSTKRDKRGYFCGQQLFYIDFWPEHKIFQESGKIKYVLASEITLNLSIEKLNHLWEWLYGEGK